MYGEGISREGDLIDLGVDKNIVEKSGAWYSYKGERIGQGRETAKLFLRENKDITSRIEVELRKVLGLRGGSAGMVPDPPPVTPEQKQAVVASQNNKPTVVAKKQ